MSTPAPLPARESQSIPSNPSNERTALIELSLVPGIGPRILGELMKHFGSATKILSASTTELTEIPGVGDKLSRQIFNARSSGSASEIENLCQTHSISILDRFESGYPGRLNEIEDPPNLLYTQGTFQPQDQMAIAIVGTRHATTYGKKVAAQLARGLAMAGFTIVSGLARGIDAAAHRGALEAGGRTVAVLGSGLLNLYPPEHADLAKEVVGQGVLASEFHPHQAPKSGSFPQRNRIVTGLSLGVVVVEAADRSGALISARLASEQNREVFAVPGRIDNRMSRGCHALINDGATLVQSVDDILEQLGPLAQPAQISSKKTIRHPAELKLTEQESAILQLVEPDPTDIDLIVAQSGLPVARVLSTVSVLEIRRLVRRVQGNKVLRV